MPFRHRRGASPTVVAMAMVAAIVVASVAFYYSSAGPSPSRQLAARLTPEIPSTTTVLTTATTSPTTSTSAAVTSPTVSAPQLTPGPSVLLTSDQLGVDEQGSDSVANWEIEVENSGTVPVSSLSIVLNTSFVASMCTNANGMLVGGFGEGMCTPVALASPLQPGQTISGDVSLDAMDMSAMPMMGTVYTLTVVATFVDGTVTSGSYYVTAQAEMSP
jgi:hypothetical protein